MIDKLLEAQSTLAVVELPRWLSGKESACQCRRCGFDPWVGKIPWRKPTATHSSILAWNPMDRGAWRATVHGVAKELDMN